MHPPPSPPCATPVVVAAVVWVVGTMSDHLMPDERSQRDVEMDRTTLLLHGTTDAMVWVQEWCRIAREVEARGESLIDEGWMVGWFGNAMGVAEMHALRDGKSGGLPS